MSPVDLLRDGLLRPRSEGAGAGGAAFEEWLESSPERAAEVAAPPAPQKAEGSCALCKERDASAVCHQCERSVCSRDHWVMFGLCRSCLPEDEVKKARSRTAPRPELGIKWIDES